MSATETRRLSAYTRDALNSRPVAGVDGLRALLKAEYAANNLSGEYLARWGAERFGIWVSGCSKEDAIAMLLGSLPSLPFPLSNAAVSIDYGATAAVGAEQCLMRGGAMLAVIDALEMSGFRCEIVVLKASSCSRMYLVEFPVKAPGETVEADRLAFIMGHPAMHRRLGFSTMEQEPKEIRDEFGFYDGYGSSCTSPEHADIKTPALYSEDQAAQWVMDTLKPYGVLMESAAQ